MKRTLDRNPDRADPDRMASGGSSMDSRAKVWAQAVTGEDKKLDKAASDHITNMKESEAEDRSKGKNVGEVGVPWNFRFKKEK